MIPFSRGLNPLTPQEEITFSKRWYDEQISKKVLKLKPIWSWNNKYEFLSTALLECNNDHCAYCDCHPLKDDRGFEIDHFKPKARFPLESFFYNNLFPSCKECNKKLAVFDPLLLKPDEVGYKFDDYFRFNSFTGEILVKKSKPVENQKRAETTIKVFKFNIGNKPSNRLKAIKKEIGTPLDERPYRYGY